jgi:hypothetical protein
VSTHRHASSTRIGARYLGISPSRALFTTSSMRKIQPEAPSHAQRAPAVWCSAMQPRTQKTRVQKLVLMLCLARIANECIHEESVQQIRNKRMRMVNMLWRRQQPRERVGQVRIGMTMYPCLDESREYMSSTCTNVSIFSCAYDGAFMCKRAIWRHQTRNLALPDPEYGATKHAWYGSACSLTCIVYMRTDHTYIPHEAYAAFVIC